MKRTAKTPLIIDCQLFQTFSRDRGMGKYSLELLRALLAQSQVAASDIHFLFNSKAKPNAELREQLRALAPQAQFIDAVLELPKEPREEYSVQPVRLTNKRLLNELLAERFGTDTKPVFLILSVYLDEVCSIFPDQASDKLLIYYDAIPYLYHERYGQFINFFNHYYLPHTATVFEATKIMTISQTVANDLHLFFGIQPECIHNIDGAPIPRAAAKPVKPAGWEIPRNQFVLMPSGQEIRKNNARAVEAFDKFVSQTGSDYRLVVTSHFNDEGRRDLQKRSDKVVFSGNVSEAELLWLYQNCRFVLFASEYEGLGLPVLEAVDQNKLVACSDISVFREMSPDAFYYFDPLDVDSMAAVLAQTDQAAQRQKPPPKAYADLRRKYSWQRTAQAFIKGWQTPLVLPAVKKKKIALFCPDPSGFSAIGKDIGELHAWYSCFFDIDYFFDKGPNHRPLRPNILQYAANCRQAEDFRAEDYVAYDAVVYHVGNSEYHMNIIRAALAFPGYMILHDTDLSGAYHNLVELGYITPQRYRLEQRLDALAGKGSKHAAQSAFAVSLVNNQLAVVTHSEYATQAVAAKLLHPVRQAYLELPFAPPIYPDIQRRLKRAKVSVAFAGIIAKVKGIDLIETIAFSEEFANCQINVFGFSAVETEQLKKLKQLPHVNVTTNPTDFEFQRLLADSDILINVRLAYKGETSGSTLSHMRYGGIALVRDFGWFSELPHDTVIKVTGPEATLAALREILDDEPRRMRLHQKSLAYMQQHHSHKAYAEGMYALIETQPSASGQ